MKLFTLRRTLPIIAITIFSTFAFLAQARAEGNKDALHLQVRTERPSGVFWDSETSKIHKPILLSWRAFSVFRGKEKVFVRWKVLDASGHRVLKGSKTYRVEKDGSVAGRSLFSPKKNGAYLWVVEAEAKRKGPNVSATSSVPFAVIAKPQVNGPSLLAINTTAHLDPNQQTFYQRIGATVWRSPLIDSMGNNPPALQDNLNWRTAHGIQTIGVLQAPQSKDAQNWVNNAQNVIDSSSNVQWEFAAQPNNSLSQSMQDAGVQSLLANLSRTAHSPLNLSLGGLWTPQKTLLLQFDRYNTWTPLPADNVNVAGRRRAIWLSRAIATRSTATIFSVSDGADSASPAAPLSPQKSADALLQNAVLARAAGAQHYAVSLSAADGGFAAPSMGMPSDSAAQLGPWQRAVGFATAARLLDHAQFVKELFHGTPAIYAALFSQNDTSTAVYWSEQSDKGNLTVRLQGLKLLDTAGNVVDTANKNGFLKVPLTSKPYFLQADVSPQIMARALRAAAISGMASVRAQVLPFVQPLESKSDLSAPRQIRVRLQNITPHPMTGVMRVKPPSGWELKQESRRFVLKAGEWRIYRFPVTQARRNSRYKVHLQVQVNNGVTGKWSGTYTPTMAVAQNVQAGNPVIIDGSLSEWKNANWMEARNKNVDRDAKLAVQWDAQNLYIAAKVDEARLATRNETSSTYPFWNSDSLQLGFGLRQKPWMRPQESFFRDTDYGFVLAPFHRSAGGNIQGRVLRLWNPVIPFTGTPDHVRWGGAIKGAVCRINYNADKKELIYEAKVPFSAITALNPQARIAGVNAPAVPVRFSWIAHTHDGTAIQWAKAAGVFPWWANSGSFLPAQKAWLAAQGLLGFAQKGKVGATPKYPTPPPSPPQTPDKPQPPVKKQPKPKKPPVVHPKPPQHQVPALPNPVPVNPIPPNTLPPAPPSD